MRSLKYAVVLAIGLTGCNSFNTYEPPHGPRGRQEQRDPPKKQDKGFFSFLFGSDDQGDQAASEVPVDSPASAPEIVIATRDEAGNVLCPYVKLVPVPQPPPVPVDQLRQLSPKDKDALIQLLNDHIDQMHQYATRVRDQSERQRRQYAAECKRWVMLHQQ
jgi:hypothetical protein